MTRKGKTWINVIIYLLPLLLLLFATFRNGTIDTSVLQQFTTTQLTTKVTQWFQPICSQFGTNNLVIYYAGYVFYVSLMKLVISIMVWIPKKLGRWLNEEEK